MKSSRDVESFCRHSLSFNLDFEDAELLPPDKVVACPPEVVSRSSTMYNYVQEMPKPREISRQACDTCRQRRIKCEPFKALETSPDHPCKRCLGASLECTFNMPVKRRGPPAKRSVYCVFSCRRGTEIKNNNIGVGHRSINHYLQTGIVQGRD
jgi:hypothetical protein